MFKLQSLLADSAWYLINEKAFPMKDRDYQNQEGVGTEQDFADCFWFFSEQGLNIYSSMR